MGRLRPAVRYDRFLPRISTAPPRTARKFRWPLVYLGVFFTTLATLLLELSLTRIFSVIFYYHYAFLAISIALFGLGAGGIVSYAIAGRPGELFTKLGWLGGATSVAVFAALLFLLDAGGPMSSLRLAAVYAVSALPFLFAGATVSLVLAETIERVGRVYFFDLLGAAGGCLLLLPLLNAFGGPNTVIVVAMLFATASAVWFSIARRPTGRIVAVALGLALMATLIINGRSPWIDVRFAKGQTLAAEQFVKWNSFSRIALQPEPASNRMTIVIDADAATGIPSFDFERLTAADYRELLYQGPGLPYVLRPGAKTLIIGPGGGWDVSRALASGSRDVTGVEINPIIADTIMRKRFPHLSKGLYLRPEVRIVIEDGRSFIRRSADRYDVIQATLVDTWASTAAGAFALSESHLYTTEAFADYLNHLTPAGVVAFTRWGFETPRESLRTVALAQAALERLGVAPADVPRQVMVIRQGSVQGWGAQDTVLIGRSPFNAADLAAIHAAVREGRLEVVYQPGDNRGTEFAELLTTSDRAGFFSRYRYAVTPVTDDQPFFFYTVQPRDLWAFLTTTAPEAADYKINRAVPLLFGLLGISLAATALILLLPPLVWKQRLPADRRIRLSLLYFLFLGAGYILIQVALIQKFVLFLGHPAYALTVIIFSMLVWSSLGSRWSDRWGAGIPLGIALLVAVLAAGVEALTATGLAWPLPAKAVVSSLTIAPAAFLMGVPFPQGLRWLEARSPESLRWAWSVNAASSVLGSAVAVFLAIYVGLRATLLIGGACYGFAFAAGRLLEPDAARAPGLP